MKRYRLIIFDSDGTLVDTLPWMRSIMNDLAETHGFRKVHPEEHSKLRDLPPRELLKLLDLPLWKVPRVLSAMRRKMAAHVDQLHAFPGIDQSLRALHHSGIRLAVVSSNSQANVEKILGPETASLIDDFECGASLFGKADKLRKVLKKFGVVAQRTLYVGDEIRDAEAARKVGMDFGAVSWGQHSRAALLNQKPDLFFQEVSDLSALCLDVPK